MGNAESVSIEIKIDWEPNSNERAFAGRVLKGNVVAKVKKEVECAPVRLILSGKEKTGVKVRKNGRLVLTEAERRFFSVTIPLRSFQDKRRVAPGEYTFPFSLKLPRSLPASDKHPSDSKKVAVGYQIQYRMTAKMGKLFQELYFPVQSAPLSPEKIPCLIQPMPHAIQSMGGMSTEGKVVLGARVNNSVVGRGKNIELCLACRNDSVVPIKCVEVQIIEFLRWTLGPKPETTDTSTVLKSVKSVQLPSTCQAKPRDQVGQTSMSTMYQEIHDELRSCREPVLISVPDTARDTYKGRLVNVWHCVKISFLTRSRVSNNATAIVPIQIGNPPVKPRRVARRQPNRQPITMNDRPMNIVIPNQQHQKQSGPPPMRPSAPPGSLSAVPEDSAQNPSNNTFPVMIAPDDLIILGADQIHRRERRGDSHSEASSVVTAPEGARPVEVSLDSLLSRMESAVSDHDLILGYLMQRSWVRLFERLAPADFGRIIARVKREEEQPRVAAMLAPHMNKGDNFTCAFAAAAIKHCSVSYRSECTKVLLPVCVDIRDNYRLILNELNEWERIATSREFEHALLAATVGQ